MSRSRYHRFDSLRELLVFCRRRYDTTDVHTTTEDHELWVKIGLGDGRYGRFLVAYFSGERRYVVDLPEPGNLLTTPSLVDTDPALPLARLASSAS